MGGFSDFLFGSKGTEGSRGYDVFYPEEYEDYAGNRANLVDYYNSIMSGKEPAWMQNYLPSIEQHQMRELDRMYLGEGNRTAGSQMDLATQTGALTGVGPKATWALQTNTADKLMQAKAAAKAAIDKYKTDWMGQSQQWASQGLQNLPRNPTYESNYYQTQPTPGSGGFLQAVAPAIGFALGGPAGAAIGSGLSSGLSSSMGRGGGGGGFDISQFAGLFNSPSGGFSSGNVPGTGWLGGKLGGQTQSEILGFDTRQFRSA